MRVLMTADVVGGVWTYAQDLAAGLAAAGVEVHLAMLGPQSASEAGGAVVRHPMPDVPLDWLAETPEAVIEGGAAMARLARSVGADLAHLNSPALAAGGAFEMPVVGVCHSDVATWWSAVRSGPLPPDLAWRAALTARGYVACDTLVAPSRSFAEATAAAFGLGTLPSVVFDGRRAEPSDPIDGEGVFACGRFWDEGKGLAVLDAAAARLGSRVSAAGPLVGPNGAAASARHVETLGSVRPADVRRRLAACAVFCSPALYEPFGLATLEAAQAARPLVLSDIPTFRELWDGAAVFVPPRDDAALAVALRALLDDPEARTRLGEAARMRAGRYTVDAMVAGTLATYRAFAPVRVAA